jgi:hypothetical protein
MVREYIIKLKNGNFLTIIFHKQVIFYLYKICSDNRHNLIILALHHNQFIK